MGGDLDKARGEVRKWLKLHLAIPYGQSNPRMELLITTTARRMCNKCAPTELEQIIAGVKPAWMNEAAFDVQCSPQAEIPAGAAEAPPPPLVLAEARPVHPPSVNLAARGFDAFCFEHEQRLKGEAVKMQKCKLHA